MDVPSDGALAGTVVSEPCQHPRGHLVVGARGPETPPDQGPGDVQVVQRRGASFPDDALRPEVLGDRLGRAFPPGQARLIGAPPRGSRSRRPFLGGRR